MSDVLNWCQRYLPEGKLQSDSDNYHCRSPLREDRHPSFSISLSKGLWCDFGTREGGTLAELAKRMGVPEPGSDFSGTFRNPRKSDSASREDESKLEEVRALWKKALPASPDHPYLSKKEIPPHTCRVTKEGVLLVPGQNLAGQLLSLERIGKDGKKRHLGIKKGAFCLIGNLEEEKPVVVAEGYATACTLSEISGFPALACFGATNVLEVVKLLKDHHRGEIIVSTDQDETGRKTAADCCGMGVLSVLPEKSDAGSDWNDYVKKYQKENAKRLFFETLEKARQSSDEKGLFRLLMSPSPEKANIPETIWYFPRKHYAVLAADPGIGKSILSMKICADLSMGLAVLGGKAEPPRKVLFLNGEASKGIFNYRFRSSAWMFDPEMFKVIHEEDCQENGVNLSLDSPEGRENLGMLIKEVSPDLLLIDSLPAYFNGDINDAQSMTSLSRFLKEIASRHNMAVVLVHHFRKRRTQDSEAEITLNEIQGSNAVLKLAGLLIGIEKRKETNQEGESGNFRLVKCLKSWLREFPPFSYEIQEDENGQLVLSVNLDPPMERQRASSWDCLFKVFSNGAEFKREAVEDVCRVSYKTASKYLRAWISQGRIEKSGYGKNTRYRISSGGRENLPRIPENPAFPMDCSRKKPHETPFLESEEPEEYLSRKTPLPRINQVFSSLDKDSRKEDNNAGVDSQKVEAVPRTQSPLSGEALLCWLEKQPEEIKELCESKRKRLEKGGVSEAASLALSRTSIRYS